jgi:hypothetical protein
MTLPSHKAFNRRRRKPMAVGWWVLLAGLLLLTHCAPQTIPIPPRVKQAPPPFTLSSTPIIESIREINNRADQRGSAATTQIEEARSYADEVDQENTSLVSEMKRLTSQKAATETELIDVYNRLVAQEKKFKALLLNLKSAELNLAEERALRIDSGKLLVVTQESVRKKEAEADELRRMLAYESSVADSYQATADLNAKAAMASAAKADKSAGTISLLWKFLIGTAVLLMISFLANLVLLRSRFPI